MDQMADRVSGRDALAPTARAAPVVEVSADQMSFQGPPRSNLTADAARESLERYSDGFLTNDILEVDSFVAVDRNGAHVFYNGASDTFELWDWAEGLRGLREREGDRSPHEGWHYVPGSEMALTAGGTGWWNDIRDGLMTPSAGRDDPVRNLVRHQADR